MARETWHLLVFTLPFPSSEITSTTTGLHVGSGGPNSVVVTYAKKSSVLFLLSLQNSSCFWYNLEETHEIIFEISTLPCPTPFPFSLLSDFLSCLQPYMSFWDKRFKLAWNLLSNQDWLGTHDFLLSAHSIGITGPDYHTKLNLSLEIIRIVSYWILDLIQVEALFYFFIVSQTSFLFTSL